MAPTNWRCRFLIDVWAEPREAAALPVILRARIRDLSTDEERYMSSLAEAERVIEARLDSDGIRPRRWERP